MRRSGHSTLCIQENQNAPAKVKTKGAASEIFPPAAMHRERSLLPDLYTTRYAVIKDLKGKTAFNIVYGKSYTIPIQFSSSQYHSGT